MKNHRLLSFFKGAALACLAFAAVSAPCFTLTSCGGGGSEELTQNEVAAKYFEGKYLGLRSQSVLCLVELGDHVKGTNMVRATISYGNSGTVSGRLVVSNPLMDGDKVEHAELQVTTDSSTLNDEDDFKRWWGAAAGENGEEVTFENAMTIIVDFEPSNNDMRYGTYEIHTFVTKDGAEKEVTKSGIAELSRTPLD